MLTESEGTLSMSDDNDDNRSNRPSILPSLILAEAIRHVGRKHDDEWLKETADRLEKRAMAKVQPTSDKLH